MGILSHPKVWIDIRILSCPSILISSKSLFFAGDGVDSHFLECQSCTWCRFMSWKQGFCPVEKVWLAQNQFGCQDVQNDLTCRRIGNVRIFRAARKTTKYHQSLNYQSKDDLLTPKIDKVVVLQRLLVGYRHSVPSTGLDS